MQGFEGAVQQSESKDFPLGNRYVRGSFLEEKIERCQQSENSDACYRPDLNCEPKASPVHFEIDNIADQKNEEIAHCC